MIVTMKGKCHDMSVVSVKKTKNYESLFKIGIEIIR
jgi:hypothetical protein